MEPIFVRINKDDDTPLPVRKTKGSAGWDVFASEDIILPSIWRLKETNNKEIVTRIKTNIYHTIPYTHVGFLYLRSGWAFRNACTIPNSVGIIDADYTGMECEIMVQIINFNYEDVNVKKYDRIAQMVYVKYEDFGVESSGLRTGGFGSTGT